MGHRVDLMKERKFTKQDWNVRDIDLCQLLKVYIFTIV